LTSRTRRCSKRFLFGDDHHYQGLGANGNPKIQTPNLDRLAARGVNFANGQITTSQCAPSRGVCLSGLETYPHEEKDLAGENRHRKTLEDLKGRLKARIKETDDPAGVWI